MAEEHHTYPEKNYLFIGICINFDTPKERDQIL